MSYANVCSSLELLYIEGRLNIYLDTCAKKLKFLIFMFFKIFFNYFIINIFIKFVMETNYVHIKYASFSTKFSEYLKFSL